jgi:hypothetical protein
MREETLQEKRERRRKLRLTAKRTAKIIATIDATPDLFIVGNSRQLLDGSMGAICQEIAELEKAIVLEESRNTTPGAGRPATDDKTHTAKSRQV